jgi:SMODS-associated and fused to various effectors sensor domain
MVDHPSLLLSSCRGLPPAAGDVTAFARGAKERMQRFVRERGARRLLLFYFGPLSGACFLGHQLNAVARQIQIMEDQDPDYAPAFLLT